MNVLIIGCSRGFGLGLKQAFESQGHTVWGMSRNSGDTILAVNWETLCLNDYEKFIRNLPHIDIVIFNQNSPALVDSYLTLGLPPTQAWPIEKKWQQSYYVNCVLSGHILHTLAETKKLSKSACVMWTLSRLILKSGGSEPAYYSGYKYQNYQLMKSLASRNTQTFVGVCPGKLTQENWSQKSKLVCDWLSQADIKSGQFYGISPTDCIDLLE